MPLLVACSSSFRTPELEKELNDTGFSMFYEQPISNEKISELISILEEREESIEEFANALVRNGSWQLLINIVKEFFINS